MEREMTAPPHTRTAVLYYRQSLSIDTMVNNGSQAIQQSIKKSLGRSIERLLSAVTPRTALPLRQ
eukprot:scaffold2830_cov123-Isochrysis_galbana.AAC.19